jgi:pre-mRNA-splicing factor 18
LLVVVECFMKHNYLDIKLAIGNAPWPIGVSIVGIQERCAREKICTSSVAHIMNDETTRRYHPLPAALSRANLKSVKLIAW